MVSDQGLTALRQGATIAHAVPTVRLRLHDADRLLAEVRRPPFPSDPATYLPVCGFREAVGRAWTLRQEGRALRFRLLDADGDPVVELGLPEGDVSFPGGIYRMRRGDEWLHLFAAPLDLQRCTDACRDGVVDPIVPLDPVLGGMVGVGFHADETTGVTLVHATCRGGRGALGGAGRAARGAAGPLRHRRAAGQLGSPSTWPEAAP